MRIVQALVFSLCAAAFCAVFSADSHADAWNKKTIVTFDEPAAIPGHVLPAGTYVFKLLDSPADRDIVQVWNANDTRLLATAMAVPDYRPDTSDHPVFEFDERPAGEPVALESWFYPGDPNGQQFLYWHAASAH
jgi:hypothetical protein